MSSETKKLWVVLCVLLSVSDSWFWVRGEPQVPCYFIFGDSLEDDGNNNNITTLAKSNYQPYGIDFPSGPTGRFCNGRTTADIIVQLLGFEDFIPPFATAGGQDILKGVNYASAAAGIRDETGRQLGDRISMNQQLRNFQTTISQIVTLLGNETSAADYLGKCIYSVGMGNNDYINNYFMPLFYSTSRQYTPEQYADVLIQEYSQQLATLHDYGARKVVVIGLGPIGCTPNQLAQSNSTSCVERINNDSSLLFNARLKPLVHNLNNNLTGVKFIYVNTYGIFEDILRNAPSLGFRVTNTGCCVVGNGLVTCLPLQTPCQNRSEYLFWDAYHPTERPNVIIAGRFYSAQAPCDTYPIDICQLAQL
ncbi:hypothetical protein HHK36_001640 [Tetracentron sinense]|uniref:Uncharacterized protein n=1 Tax=Tetracentron sinense TaxID=13715 RepID=A0A834ZYH1_TETSI|nr:hypothetical protein HHK36_001640 [Tetracentron sinense]